MQSWYSWQNPRLQSVSVRILPVSVEELPSWFNLDASTEIKDLTPKPERLSFIYAIDVAC
jgi:hypothetical protein